MASYTPVNLRTAIALTITTNDATTKYTPSGSNVGVVQTTWINAIATHTVSLSLSPNTSAGVIYWQQSVTAGVPVVINARKMIANGSNLFAYCDSVATNAPTYDLDGLEYTP